MSAVEARAWPQTASEALSRFIVPPGSLRLSEAVWGIDASTVRVSIAAVLPIEPDDDYSRIEWDTLSLPSGARSVAWRFAAAHAELLPWIERMAVDRPPMAVLLEEPFGSGKRTVHPSSNRMLGVLLAVLGTVLGERVQVDLLGPQSWKRLALGEGRGHAGKGEVLRWAQCAGYTGVLEDEADAIGVATACGVRVEQARRGFSRSLRI
jgi:hypothetical protein